MNFSVYNLAPVRNAICSLLLVSIGSLFVPLPQFRYSPAVLAGLAFARQSDWGFQRFQPQLNQHSAAGSHSHEKAASAALGC